MVDPALPHPVVHFNGKDSQLASEIRDPPLVPSQQVIAKQFASKSQSADQVPNASFGEAATTARRGKSLAVERVGDLEVMEPGRVQFTDSLRQLSVVFQF